MEAAELQRARAWLAEKWGDRSCPVCEAEHWDIAANIGQIPNLLPIAPHGGNTVPVFLVVCQACGYVLTVNAIIAGVIQPANAMVVPAQPGAVLEPN